MTISFNPEWVVDHDASMDYPLIPVGEHDAVIVSATEKTSKAGNDMIELVLEIEHEGGRSKVWDYLTFSQKAMGVVAAKCRVLGLDEQLEAGELSAEDFTGAMCRVKIRHEKSKEYGTREKVAYFIPTKSSKPAAESAQIKDEDIPF